MKDKIALVTGAAQGIGEATARAFAREGAAVSIVDMNEEGASRVAAAINDNGGRAVGIGANVGDPGEAEKAVQQTVAALGGLDYLVNNAAAQDYGSAEETEPERWDAIIRDTLTAPFLMCKYAVPKMRARGGGAIVNIGSVLGLTTAKGAVGYVSAKHGIIGLTKSVALDAGDAGIRVNCLCPGAIDTPRVRREAERADDPDEVMRNFGATKILKRIGTPEEIAEAVLFLCSERSSFITGAILLADGGMLAPCPGVLGNE